MCIIMDGSTKVVFGLTLTVHAVVCCAGRMTNGVNTGVVAVTCCK